MRLLAFTGLAKLRFPETAVQAIMVRGIVKEGCLKGKKF